MATLSHVPCRCNLVQIAITKCLNPKHLGRDARCRPQPNTDEGFDKKDIRRNSSAKSLFTVVTPIGRTLVFYTSMDIYHNIHYGKRCGQVL